MPLTLEAILGAKDLKTVDVDVPEWGGQVRIRTISGLERDAFEQSVIEKKSGKREANLANIRARFCALCIVDEAGRRIFGDEQAYDLGLKSAAALDRIFEAAQKLNGMSKDDVEELAKN